MNPFESQVKQVEQVKQQALFTQKKQQQLIPHGQISAVQALPQAIKGKKLYYKYCCTSCIHLQNSNKSCVCIVPRSKRKKNIGQQGCQTCKCRGCTAQDELIKNQQQRKRKRQKRQRQERSRSRQKFNPENGCCKKCIRALSKNRKACLCQVPKNVRNSKLPAEGCKLCGCHGCHPRDHGGKYQYSSEENYSYEVQSQKDDQQGEDMNNVDNSVIGKVIAMEYSAVYAPMLGLGIPQRTPSYILGKPL